jgi:hypothetical protein
LLLHEEIDAEMMVVGEEWRENGGEGDESF